MTKTIDFITEYIKITVLLAGLFYLGYYLISKFYLEPLCENTEKWYCVSNQPTIIEQLLELDNSTQQASWKVTLNHSQTDNTVKITPQIESKNRFYLSLLEVNKSSDTIIIKSNNYPIDTSLNDKFDLVWNVDLTAGKNVFKVIITPDAINWQTILSSKDVELIESLQKRVNFWTTESLIINGK